MEEILLALGLKSILSIILPIVVIIALIMIVSRLGNIRNDIYSLRSRLDKKDIYETFDRNSSMSEEEMAEEIAKNELLEHMQEEPVEYEDRVLDPPYGEIIAGAFSIYIVSLFLISESYAGFWSWIRWIVFLLLAAYIPWFLYSNMKDEEKKFEKKLKRWEKKYEELQKKLDDLRK